MPIRALEDLVDARPDARVMTFAETGHVPMVERPTEFTTALVTLLRAGDAAASSDGSATPVPGAAQIDQSADVSISATNPSELRIILP